jgi:hypothetical protein
MSRSHAERVGDVARVVDAARAEAAGRGEGTLVADLVRSTGLTREGVDLAFARHLELAPTDAEIEALVRGAGDAKHVVVILSANVFVGALRAIAIARAASPSVVVRPSRREPYFARALVHAAVAAGDRGLTLADDVDLGRLFGGEVHVYGRDATIAEVRARVGERIRVRGHGAGMGVAFVGEGPDLASSAERLAYDVIAFDQRGCLSPRVAFVEGGAARAEAFALALDDALTQAAQRVPRGALAEDERADATRWRDTLLYAGRVIDRPSHSIGVAGERAPLLVAPPGRHVHLAPARDAGEAQARIAEIAPIIVAVGADDEATAKRIAPRHARVSALGEMQRPPLDGPVDRR